MVIAVPDADPLELALERELRHSERIAWQGQPVDRLLLSSFAIWFFAIPWTAFALFWIGGATGALFGNISWGGVVFALFGVPFVAVGIGMLTTPFLFKLSARRTIFAVTDQRLIKISLWRSLTTHSVPLDRVDVTERSESADGSGTLAITVRIGTDSDGDTTKDKFGIGIVDDIMQVERHVRHAAERYQRSSASS